MTLLKDELILEAGQGLKHYWRDLWSYRELFFFLAWRDVAVRYKQTAIGVAWAVIRPVLVMIIFTIIFGRLAQLPSDGVPYPILVYSAMLPWQLFANALAESSNSLISNAQMISKVYFPRLAIPFSSVVVSFIDFAIAFVILVGLMIWYQYTPGWPVLLLPLFIILACSAALERAYGWLPSTLNIAIFATLYPLLSSLGCMSRRWGLAVALCQTNGAYSTRSTRWSALSMVFVGPFWATPPSTGPASCYLWPWCCCYSSAACGTSAKPNAPLPMSFNQLR